MEKVKHSDFASFSNRITCLLVLRSSVSQNSIFCIICDPPIWHVLCACNLYRWLEWGVHRYMEGFSLRSGMSGYHFPFDEYWSPETKRSYTSHAGRETSPLLILCLWWRIIRSFCEKVCYITVSSTAYSVKSQNLFSSLAEIRLCDCYWEIIHTKKTKLYCVVYFWHWEWG